MSPDVGQNEGQDGGQDDASDQTQDVGERVLEDGAIPSGTDGATVACIRDLQSIALSPAVRNVTLHGVAAEPISFAAEATFRDGRRAPLDPSALAWRVERDDDTDAGRIAAGVFMPNPSAGGVVTVIATDGCLDGRASVTFFLDITMGEPPAPNGWTSSATTAEGAVPTVVYPSHETRFPRNIQRTVFQWRKGAAREFRLTFEGSAAKVVIFTNGAHPLCAGATPLAGCWEADAAASAFIAGSNAGGLVRWTVEGLDRSGTTPVIRKSASIVLGFSKRDVRGAIFYWSTTSAGIRRANIRESEPEDYMTGRPPTVYSDDTVQCVACHVVSRDGRYLVAPVKASSGDSLWVAEVTARGPPTPRVRAVSDTRGHGFATISPDDETVVAAWRGAMWTLNRANGAKISNIALGGLRGTHPDWSPDNTQLAFATGEGDAPSRASIAVMAYDRVARSFGAPSILVPAAGATNLFPMFSPDGVWLAYVRGRGGHGDLTAQLFLVRGVGSPATPVELRRANRIVSNRETDGLHQNSQPTWAPPGDIAWVAFNSKREYGVVRPEGTQQIWVAALDLRGTQPGEDPSFPAFRLPTQGLDENNHRAFWALDVRDEPSPDGGLSDASDGGAPNASDGGAAGPDAGARPDGGECRAFGAACEPGVDTCCNGGLCDTRDDGDTYICLPNL